MIHGLDTGFLVAAELTTNQSDFLVFGVFTCIPPGGSVTNP